MKPFLLTVACLLRVALSAFAQQPAATLAPTLAEARALISAGQPKAAISKLQALPPSTYPLLAQLLGVAYYHANDHANAIKQLAPLADQLPKNSPAWRETIQLLGLACYLLGRLPEAVAYLEQTRAWAPDDHELAYVLGMAAIQTRQPDQGRTAFARMFRVAPDSAAAHLLTAQMMQRVELEEPAAAELKAALALDPRLPQANYLLAQTAIFRGKLDEAIALLERELAVNPGNANAYYKLGDAYTRLLRWDEAISALQKSVWLNPFYRAAPTFCSASPTRRRTSWRMPKGCSNARCKSNYNEFDKSESFFEGETVMEFYLGVDFHPHQQTVAWVDLSSGEIKTRQLLHNTPAVKEFYAALPKAIVGFNTSTSGAPSNPASLPSWPFARLLRCGSLARSAAVSLSGRSTSPLTPSEIAGPDGDAGCVVCALAMTPSKRQRQIAEQTLRGRIICFLSRLKIG